MKPLLLAPLVVVVLQIATNPTAQQRPQGSIEGTVTRLGSGQPVPSAQVRLTRRGGPAQALGVGALPPGVQISPGAQTPAGARGAAAAPPAPIPAVTTDERGRFTFTGLDEGSYVLQVQANGYVNQPYGQRFPNGPGTPIAVGAGQTLRDISVILTPASNISGRVRDNTDQSLINVPVQLLRYSYDSSGARSYQPVAAAQTNDRGEYRLYWVTPGHYYLLAGRPSTGSNPFTELITAELGGIRPNGNEVPPVLGYAFYPGVTEIASARTIDLTAGADLQSVDLVLTPKPRTYSVRGKLVDARTGQSPPRATVFVATQTPGLGGNGIEDILGPDGPGLNYNAKTGTFEIRELLPGAYTVIATAQDPAVPGRSGPIPQSSGTLPVSIASSDVDGLTLSLVPAAPITGRLRIEGQLPGNQTIDRMRIQLSTAGSTPTSLALRQNNSAQVSADGTFRLSNITPGEYRINVFPIAGNSFLKDVRFEGADALNTPFRFSGTSNIGLELVVAVGGGRLDGIVTDARSQPLPSTRVVLVPDRSRYRSDIYKTAVTDQNGRYVMSGIAPGDYKLFSWESIEENGWFDPDIIARSEAGSRAVHINETTAQTIDIRIIPAEGGR